VNAQTSEFSLFRHFHDKPYDATTQA